MFRNSYLVDQKCNNGKIGSTDSKTSSPQIKFVQMYHEVNYEGKFYKYKYKSRNSNYISVVPSSDGCTIIALPEHVEVEPGDGAIGT